jgi:hypothetical protein
LDQVNSDIHKSYSQKLQKTLGIPFSLQVAASCCEQSQAVNPKRGQMKQISSPTFMNPALR